jgi:hypothetical protein
MIPFILVKDALPLKNVVGCIIAAPTLQERHSLLARENTPPRNSFYNLNYPSTMIKMPGSHTYAFLFKSQRIGLPKPSSRKTSSAPLHPLCLTTLGLGFHQSNPLPFVFFVAIPCRFTRDVNARQVLIDFGSRDSFVGAAVSARSLCFHTKRRHVSSQAQFAKELFFF